MRLSEAIKKRIRESFVYVEVTRDSQDLSRRDLETLSATSSKGIVIDRLSKDTPLPEKPTFTISKGEVVIKGTLEGSSRATCIIRVPIEEVSSYYEFFIETTDRVTVSDLMKSLQWKVVDYDLQESSLTEGSFSDRLKLKIPMSLDPRNRSRVIYSLSRGQYSVVTVYDKVKKLFYCIYDEDGNELLDIVDAALRRPALSEESAVLQTNENIMDLRADTGVSV